MTWRTLAPEWIRSEYIPLGRFQARCAEGISMSKASHRQTRFYYRLNEFGITLLPLRERDDILHLANEFLREASMELGRPCHKISEAAAEILLRYHWPGNVRELRNVIRRAILLASDVIEPEHLVVLPVDPH